jgi:hypothetical protein
MTILTMPGRCVFQKVSCDHVIAVQSRRFGPLQWFLSWALLSGTADDPTIVQLLYPIDVVVFDRRTGATIDRRGPYFGADFGAVAAGPTVQACGTAVDTLAPIDGRSLGEQP